MGQRQEQRCPFIFTKATPEGYSYDDLKHKDFPVFSLQRLSVYVEIKKELDRRLLAIPGGNIEIIAKLYEIFDEAIMDELNSANTFNSQFERRF